MNLSINGTKSLNRAIVLKEESYAIIGACIEVHKQLGSGFLEAVYHEALILEFAERNIPSEHERELPIYYKGVKLSKKYYSDFVCYDKIIIELKALNKLASEHQSQVLNYLKATNYKLGILVNFGEASLKYKRLVL